MESRDDSAGTPTEPVTPAAGAGSDMRGGFVAIGLILIGCGVLLDWMATGSSRVLAIWLLIERLTGDHGFRDWMIFGGLGMFAGSANEIALRGRGRWLRRVPTLLMSGAMAAFAWYSFGADRYVLVGACGLVAFATLGDPQRALPEARVIERT